MGKRRMRFKTWCAKDPDDERKINYTFKDGRTHKTYYFTSENELDIFLFLRIQKAWIESIELVKNEFNNPEGEWYVVLYEYEY